MELQNCPTCGAILFNAIPFVTTPQEIVEFARSSALPFKENIEQRQWIHPGLYCPNGCYIELVDYSRGYPMPEITQTEALSVIKAYAKAHLTDFAETHGENSRFLACVHCENFDRAVVEGQPSDAFYRNPELRPLRNHRLVEARCKDNRIQSLDHEWWYDQGEDHPQCELFTPSSLFIIAYKRMTGWSEYSDE